jgi:hypothetical protein
MLRFNIPLIDSSQQEPILFPGPPLFLRCSPVCFTEKARMRLAKRWRDQRYRAKENILHAEEKRDESLFNEANSNADVQHL